MLCTILIAIILCVINLECLSILKELSVDDCFTLGFNKNILQCKTCETLIQVVGDSELHVECNSCCTTPMVEETYKYIVLEVDKRIVSSFPDVAAIIKEKKQLHLTVRYRIGKRPSLHMYKQKSDDAPSESVSIFSWNKDAIADYVKSHYDA